MLARVSQSGGGYHNCNDSCLRFRTHSNSFYSGAYERFSTNGFD
jgi:hypothetical protein